jgi:hypothetical protein
MADPSVLDVFRIPTEALIALDNRPFHFALQPYHYLIRLSHVLSAAAFFGGIGLLDLRLLGWRGTVVLRPFAEHVLPWLYATFGLAFVSGVALFLYDPVHVGSHAYFTLKLMLIAAGLANAGLFHRSGYIAALAAETRMPMRAKLAGGASLLLWFGAMTCASLNVEAAPKVLLR